MHIVFYRLLSVPIAATALLLSPAVHAQTTSAEVLAALDAQLPGTLANDPTGLDWETTGKGFKRDIVTGDDIPGGGAAIQFQIRKAGTNPYDIVTNIPITKDIGKGDVITAGFYARTLKSDAGDGKGAVTVRFQRNIDPWPGFAEKTLAIGDSWNWYEVSGRSTIDIREGDGVVSLQLAGAKQTIEIGQAIVVTGASAILGQVKQEPALPSMLAGKGTLINSPDNRRWSHNQGTAFEAFDDPVIFLGKGTRFTSPMKSENAWDVETNIPVGSAIKAGDKLLLAIAVRTQSTTEADGKAIVGIRVQSALPPYDGFADNDFKVGTEWQMIQLRTTATMDMPKDTAVVALHFANAQQVVDIGPVYVLKTE